MHAKLRCMSKRDIKRIINRMLEKRGYEPLERYAKIEPIFSGSTREFYRIIEADYTLVAMFASVHREVKEYRNLQKFLVEKDVGVPAITVADVDSYIVLMEDVGRKSLYGVVKEATDMDFIEHLYKEVIKSLIRMQIEGSKGIEECKPVNKKFFNYDSFKWESNYFKWFFLKRFCKLTKGDLGKVDEEFHNLAKYLVDEPLFFMHRDFQSTNIFLKDGLVRIVDFQDAHRGLLTYDLASLLRDAYVSLSAEMRNRLFSSYYSLLRKNNNLYKDIKKFRRVYVLSAIQRNMQALGAFAFLSKIMKKRWFRKAIPQGLKYLKEGLEEIDEFKVLNEIVNFKKVTRCVKSIIS